MMNFWVGCIKIKILFIALLCSNALAFGQLADLKVMSFNLRYNNAHDGINSWPNRSGNVKTFLFTESADIIGFQEVLHNEILELDRALFNYNFDKRHYKRVGVGREDGETKGEFSPIYFNSDKFNLLSFKTIWLSETPNKPSKGWDAACERIATFALLFNKESHDSILVVNTHWDHVGVTARRNSAALILKEINEFPIVSNTLILGDFNCTRNEQELQTLVNSFNDAGFSANKEIGTFNNFSREKLNEASRIDFIFYRLKNLGFSNYRVGNLNAEEPLLSDHFPVMAEFTKMKALATGQFQFNLKNNPLEYADSLLHIDLLKCYVGNMEFLDANKQVLGKDSIPYRLLNFSDPASMRFSIPFVGGYACYVRLTLGVDSITNAAGVHCCALDPANGMYWSWQSGYIQFKLEGKEKGGNALNLHLGGFSNAHMSSITTEIPILRIVTGGPIQPPNRRSQDVTIHLNLNSFLELVHANKEYSLMSPNDHVHEYMRALGTSFSAIMK
jgi:endonuclease/exonuclease/phosphatase family metal-dependent hydrolase